MSKIKHIAYHNLKGGDVEMDLTGFDVFAGPNGCGKTALLQAIKIAIAGHDPAVGKSAQKIFQLASGENFDVDLTMDDGFNIRRSFKREDGAVRSGISINPSDGVRTNKDREAIIEQKVGSTALLVDIRELVNLTPAMQVEFFLRMCPMERDMIAKAFSQATSTIITKCLETDLETEKKEVLMLPLEATVVSFEDLYKVIDEMKESLNYERRRYGDVRKAIAAAKIEPHENIQNLQKEYDKAEVTEKEQHGEIERNDEVVKAARGRATTKNDVEQELLRLATAVADLEDLTAKNKTDLKALGYVIGLADKEDNLRDSFTECQTLTFSLDKKQLKMREQINSVKRTIEHIKGGSCPICKQEVDKGILLGFRDTLYKMEADNLEFQNGEYSKAVKIRTASEAELKAFRLHRNEIEKKHRSLKEEGSELAVKLAKQQERVKVLDEQLAKIREQATETTLPIDERILRGQLEITQGNKQKVRERLDQALKNQQDAFRKSEWELDEIRIQKCIDVLKMSLEHLDDRGILGKLVTRQLGPVLKEANNMLADGFQNLELRLQFDDRFHLMTKQGVPVHMLSTGELMVLSTIILVTILNIMRPPTRVLLIDNMEALDMDNRGRFIFTLLKQYQDKKIDNVVMSGCFDDRTTEWFQNSHLHFVEWGQHELAPA